MIGPRLAFGGSACNGAPPFGPFGRVRWFQAVARQDTARFSDGGLATSLFFAKVRLAIDNGVKTTDKQGSI